MAAVSLGTSSYRHALPHCGGRVYLTIILPLHKAAKATPDKDRYQVFTLDQLQSILKALPDPALILTRSGRYAAIFGGADHRYYHDGSSLIGKSFHDVMPAEKAAWFLNEINTALVARTLHVVEYSLAGSDLEEVEVGPNYPIWFEGRIQALDFKVLGEDAVVWVASNITEKNRVEHQLRLQSETDPLTGLFNRRRLIDILNRSFEQVKTDRIATSVLIFDVDNFKQINDRRGHQTGDQALLTVAELCRCETRKDDFVARLGGDEFIIIMPSTTAETASVIANRLRQRIGTELQKTLDETSSISGGVSQILESDLSCEDVLARADNGLYAAKKAGRDQIRIHC